MSAYNPKFKIGQHVRDIKKGEHYYIYGVSCEAQSNEWDVIYALSTNPVRPCTTNEAVIQTSETQLMTDEDYKTYLNKKAIKQLRENGFNIECNGIKLDANNYSGCNASHGDCPNCGG